VAVPVQDRVGSYRLIGLIRAGHACEIWKVQHADQESQMAMKLLRRGPHHNRHQIGLLRHEYAVGQQLSNEAVIRVYDFGSNAIGSYLVMELYPFLNLKQRIQQGIDLIAYITKTLIRQSAMGLHYMHEMGWVHCDVKPDNFLANDQGKVKLIDFSLAQRRRGRLSRMFAGKSKIQGTKSYMSPEQIRGLPVDPRSDVYAFGCVIHELVTGKVPFTGTSANELLTKHLRTLPPPVTSINSNVTTEFAQLVGQMMAKDPAKRPDSMLAVIEELDRNAIFRRPPEPPQEGVSPTSEDTNRR
jgi:eukaryotic-like serine/threonine-protein kinase